MNSNRRRQSGESFYQGGRRARRGSSKPPIGNQLPPVPSWEKKFCWEVGRMPWSKLLGNKKYMDIYPKILKWNDSATEEAFINAKARYWAQINGLSCDVPLPNPDAHVDDVNWNLSDIDRELLLDYDREFVVDHRKKGEGVIIFGNEFLKSKGFSSYGWGDEVVDKTDQNGGWDARVPWEGFKEYDQGEHGWVGNSGWNQWDAEVENVDNQKEVKVNNQWECNKHCYQGDDEVYNQWETRNGNGRRRGNFVLYQQVWRPNKHSSSAKQENN